VILRVRSDPEPGHSVVLQKAEGTPAAPDPHGVEGFLAMNPLEMETGMSWIVSPETVALPSALSDVGGKLAEKREEFFSGPGLQRSSTGISLTRPARMSARTLAAILPSCSWERANDSSQRCSSANSSRITAAMASCSASGSP